MKAGTLPVFIYPRGLSILSPFLPVLEVTIFIFCLSFLFCIAVESLGHVRLFETPWTAAHQAPLSMGFSQQEYWSGLPFLSPKNTGVGCYALFQGIFPTQGSNLCLLLLLPWQAGSLPLAPPGKTFYKIYTIYMGQGIHGASYFLPLGIFFSPEQKKSMLEKG